MGLNDSDFARMLPQRNDSLGLSWPGISAEGQKFSIKSISDVQPLTMGYSLHIGQRWSSEATLSLFDNYDVDYELTDPVSGATREVSSTLHRMSATGGLQLRVLTEEVPWWLRACNDGNPFCNRMEPFLRFGFGFAGFGDCLGL